MNGIVLSALASLLLPAALAEGKKNEIKLTKDETTLLELTNAERGRRGLAPFRASAKLFAVARAHAANMARQQRLDHTLDGKGVSMRVAECGYASGGVGENIGWNYADPGQAVAGWMASGGHRANLLSLGYTEVGLAVARSATGEAYWVQVFAAPRP